MRLNFSLIPEIGIDLGTANILVYKRGQGIVLREPSVVAIDRNTKKVKGGGRGSPPDDRAHPRQHRGDPTDERRRDRGLHNHGKNAVVHDFGKVCGKRRAFKPRVIICVPAGVTSVEKRAVWQAAISAGAGEAATIEETMAAAIGAGLPIGTPGGNMVVDMGGGTTDIAVISLGGIVVSRSLRIGGNKMDEVIIRHIRNNYNLMIGERTAEEIKIKIGSVFPMDEEMTMEVRGRDLIVGLAENRGRLVGGSARSTRGTDLAGRGQSKSGVGANPPGTVERHHRAWHHAHRRRRTASWFRPACLRWQLRSR